LSDDLASFATLTVTANVAKEMFFEQHCQCCSGVDQTGPQQWECWERNYHYISSYYPEPHKTHLPAEIVVFMMTVKAKNPAMFSRRV
jgi:hypothetical protein